MAFYKRTLFLINKNFQLKFSLIVSSIVIISTSIYPFIIYDFFNILTLKNTKIPENIINAQREVILYLFLVQLIVAVLVFVFFIFISHKIAGPLYKLKNHLISIREGEPVSPITFRSGDYFDDVADEVNLFLESIERKQDSDFQYLDEVAEYIENISNVVPDDKKPVLNEISRRLVEIRSRYKKHWKFKENDEKNDLQKAMPT